MAILRVRSRNLHLEWRGGFSADRETAVFLHDGLGSSRAWGDVPERICGPLDCNALLYDRWGYGRSEVRPEFADGFLEDAALTLAALLQQLELERVHLIGHSDGASIALIYAAANPARVASLTAAAPHTFVEPEAQDGIRRHLIPEKPGAGFEWLRRQHGDKAEALLTNWTSRWTSERQSRWDMRESLSRIVCPILVVQGDRDEYATLAQVSEIETRAARAESWIVPDCGHVPHFEAREDFIRRVSDFLATRLVRNPAV